MGMSLKKKSLIGIIALVVIIAVILFLGRNELASSKTATVKRGNFELAISVKGEIHGKNSVSITLDNLFKNRNLRIHNLKIKDLIQEGTIVKKGDWVATLDVANITQQFQENNDKMEERLSNLESAKIDSTIELTNFREEIKEFKFDIEYKELELEQAKFESLAYQRKAKVAYDKIIRQMDAKLRNYERKKLDWKVKMHRTERDYNYYVQRDSLLTKAVIAAQIKAPQDGMVMYAKVRGARKIRVGDEISPWNPVIASLPDLSVLVSETYVQEIDITKIAIGDSVEIIIDALPNKKYSGIISEIANIGQELSGFDTKVFNVLIDMNENGEEIKPAMTTNNRIILTKLNNVIKIPRDCLFSDHGVKFVYLKHKGKIWKKKVVPGLENDKELVINGGLKEKDKIYTSAPNNAETIPFFEN